MPGLGGDACLSNECRSIERIHGNLHLRSSPTPYPLPPARSTTAVCSMAWHMCYHRPKSGQIESHQQENPVEQFRAAGHDKLQ